MNKIYSCEGKYIAGIHCSEQKKLVRKILIALHMLMNICRIWILICLKPDKSS